MRLKRVPFTVLAAIFFVAISSSSTPSDPAPTDLTRTHRPARQRTAPAKAVQRMPAAARVTPRQFRAVTPRDVEAALFSRPQHLELFPRELADAARREMLVDLPYGKDIWRVSQRHEVDGLLVAAIVEVESGFTPEAVSPKGALGLMQLVPETGDLFGVQNLHDPRANLDAGTRYLKWLLREFDGDLELALAAYNAGPATVARYHGVPPYRETRQYVRKVLALYRGHSEAAWERAGTGRDPFAPLPAAAR